MGGGYGYIYTSTDSGATWVQRKSAGERGWSAVASSSDGTKLVAVGRGGPGEWSKVGFLYSSSDSGVTWTLLESAGKRTWVAVASSADGTKLVAAENIDEGVGYLYVSADSGVTWTRQTSLGNQWWGTLALSSDGLKVIAAANCIYTGTALKVPLVDEPIIGPVATTSATLGATVESDGGLSIIQSGIVYGTAANPDTTGNKVISGADRGPFTVDVSGLIPNTAYHFRGYATNVQWTS